MKDRLIKDIKQAAEEMKLVDAGKLVPRNARDVINQLKENFAQTQTRDDTDYLLSTGANKLRLMEAIEETEQDKYEKHDLIEDQAQ